MTTITALRPGIYRILVVARVGVDSDSVSTKPDEPSGTGGAKAASGVEHQYLTDSQWVTILPPSAHPDPKQLVTHRISDELNCLLISL